MIPNIIFTLTFLASLALSAYQMRNGAGFSVGTWFLPLYFFLLFAVTNLRHRIKKILLRIFFAGLALFCAAFIIVSAHIMIYPQIPAYREPAVLIVLGARTIGYEPATVLAHRLDAAIGKLGHFPYALCIVSGGQGPDAIIPEAQAMRQYLINHGIYGGRIFMESNSSNTFENLLFSRELAEQHNIMGDGGAIVVLTSDFHIPRAMMLARRVFGGAEIYAVKADTPFALFSAGITREFFAFVKSFVFDRE